MSETLNPLETAPSRHRFTADEYANMVAAGTLGEQRVQLIDGEIVNMPAQGEAHFYVLWKTQTILQSIFPSSAYWVRSQSSLKLAGHVPDPDIAVIDGAPAMSGRVFNDAIPILVVEVADTSLAYDLGDKASLYASARIADYWVMDVKAKSLIMHRQPTPDPLARFGVSYAAVERFDTSANVTPLAFPAKVVRVAECFN